MMIADMTPAMPAVPAPLAVRMQRLIQAATLRGAIRALAARHAAARSAAAVAELDDHIRDDIGLPRREPLRQRAGFWLV